MPTWAERERARTREEHRLPELIGVREQSIKQIYSLFNKPLWLILFLLLSTATIAARPSSDHSHTPGINSIELPLLGWNLYLVGVGREEEEEEEEH